MNTQCSAVRAHYQAEGFVHFPAFFAPAQLQSLQEVVQRFHAAWLADNAAQYNTRAINSAYLTAGQYLERSDRLVLFQFLAQPCVAEVLAQVFSGPAAFMNTQLFFNPHNPLQPNYWHRDIQYTGLSVEDQQRALGSLQVVHLRVALRPEPGLELVPGSHQRWDTEEEFAVRMEQGGNRSSDALAGARQVALQTGDLLVFSANMLHRGLYGMDRLAFDMLFCAPESSLLAHVREDCLPDADMLAMLPCPQVFALARVARQVTA